MAFTPPGSPVNNQIYSDGVGKNWIWNGAQWIPYNPPLGVAAITAATAINAGSASATYNGPFVISGVQPALNLLSNVSGILPITKGGTGLSTLTANNVILGNGTSTVQFVAPGSTGNLLTSNGTTWTSSAPALAANFQEFLSSGTWTKPANAQFVMVECLSAGGAGGNSSGGDFTSGTSSGGGGAGGSYAYMLFKASDLTATVTVTVGAGGTTTATNGNAGGASSFGSFLQTYGGGGGLSGDTSTNGGNGAGVLGGAAPVGKTATSVIVYGAFGGTLASDANGSFSSGFGGGGGGSRTTINSNNGGSSYLGGAGGGAGPTNENTSGGNGGSTATSGRTGGNGGTSVHPTSTPGTVGSLGCGGGGGARAGWDGDASYGTKSVGANGGGGLVRVYTW